MAKRITVLISGRGSNLDALLAAIASGSVDATVTRVITNVPGAPGLDVARAHGVAGTTIDHRVFATRDAFDTALALAIDAERPDLVVLAGFMRVLCESFVHRYAGRLINVHPSLLPLYPGLQTHRRALADGARVHGCTVHFVTPEVDGGPIIAQSTIPVLDSDDESSLAARVLAQEHLLLPNAVRWFCEDRLVIEAGRVRVKGLPQSEAGAALHVRHA